MKGVLVIWNKDEYEDWEGSVDRDRVEMCILIFIPIPIWNINYYLYSYSYSINAKIFCQNRDGFTNTHWNDFICHS